jgi:hypothetical protein
MISGKEGKKHARRDAKWIGSGAVKWSVRGGVWTEEDGTRGGRGAGAGGGGAGTWRPAAGGPSLGRSVDHGFSESTLGLLPPPSSCLSLSLAWFGACVCKTTPRREVLRGGSNGRK